MIHVSHILLARMQALRGRASRLHRKSRPALYQIGAISVGGATRDRS